MRADGRGHGSGVSSSLSPSRPPPDQARQSRSWIPGQVAQPKRPTGGWAGRQPASSRATPQAPPVCCTHHPLLQGSDLNPSWRAATRIGPSMLAIPVARQVVRAPAGCGPGAAAVPGQGRPPWGNPRPRSRRGGVVPGRQCPGRHRASLRLSPALPGLIRSPGGGPRWSWSRIRGIPGAPSRRARRLRRVLPQLVLRP